MCSPDDLDAIYMYMYYDRLLGLTREVHLRRADVMQCPPIDSLFKKLVINQGFPLLLEELAQEIDCYETKIEEQEAQQMNERGQG